MIPQIALSHATGKAKISNKRQNPRMIMALAGASALLLGACTNGGGLSNLDWDLRQGDHSTSADARQATAARPQADSNGVISYPGYQMAAARANETVAAVGNRLGVNATELARANALQPGDYLREGELLLLPRRVSAAPQPMVAASTTAAPTPMDITSVATTALNRVETTPLAPASPVTPATPVTQVAPKAATQVSKPTTAAAAAAQLPGGGKEPMRHTVQRGETAFVIARAYNITAKSLAEWNNLNAEMMVREGQTLIIPVATAPARASEPVATAPGSGTPTPVPPSASKPLPQETSTPAAQKPKETPKSPELAQERTAASAAALVMPASGTIIRSYNKKSNQGIDIAAAAGSSVKAADAGTIAAITRDTDQVQIVVIRHANGLLTVYAGVDGLKVAKGDSVSRGQQIGVVRAASPSFLHFEVRKGVDSVDPMGYLQ